MTSYYSYMFRISSRCSRIYSVPAMTSPGEADMLKGCDNYRLCCSRFRYLVYTVEEGQKLTTNYGRMEWQAHCPHGVLASWILRDRKSLCSAHIKIYIWKEWGLNSISQEKHKCGKTCLNEEQAKFFTIELSKISVMKRNLSNTGGHQ